MSNVTFQDSELIDGTLASREKNNKFVQISTEKVNVIIDFTDLYESNSKIKEIFDTLNSVEYDFELDNKISDQLKDQLNVEGNQIFYTISLQCRKFNDKSEILSSVSLHL